MVGTLRTPLVFPGTERLLCSWSVDGGPRSQPPSPQQAPVKAPQRNAGLSFFRRSQRREQRERPGFESIAERANRGALCADDGGDQYGGREQRERWRFDSCRPC